MSILLRSLLLTTVSLPASAGTSIWYVDVNATPPGDGSPGSPYASIQYALDQPTTLDGDDIVVAPGTYVETIVVPENVELRSSGGPAVTFLLPEDPRDATVVQFLSLFGAIDGFTVTRASSSGGQVGIRSPECPANLVVVRNCIVTNHAVGILASYDLTLHGSTITGNDIGIDNTCVLIPRLRNTIAWGNATVDIRTSDEASIHDSLVGTVEASDCVCDYLIDDPRFWDAAGGDFHLRVDSPCIDAGNPAEQDPDGSRRDIGAIPYDASWAPGTQAFCFGSDALCPCANGGSGAGGCDLPQGTGGVVLSIEGFAPNGAGGGSAAIVGSGYPPAAQPGVTLIRSPGVQDPPVVFGDGLRCIAASGLVRIGAVLAQGGASLHSVNHGAGAGTFRYQLWTRSTPSTFCDPTAAFNLSNGLEVVWP